MFIKVQEIRTISEKSQLERWYIMRNIDLVKQKLSCDLTEQLREPRSSLGHSECGIESRSLTILDFSF